MTTHCKGYVVAAPAGLVDRLGEMVLVDEEYRRVMLRDLGSPRLELTVAGVDVERAAQSAVAAFEGSEPLRPRVSVMQGHREK